MLRSEETRRNGDGEGRGPARRRRRQHPAAPHLAIRREVLERNLISREVAGFELQLERHGIETGRNRDDWNGSSGTRLGSQHQRQRLSGTETFEFFSQRVAGHTLLAELAGQIASAFVECRAVLLRIEQPASQSNVLKKKKPAHQEQHRRRRQPDERRAPRHRPWESCDGCRGCGGVNRQTIDGVEELPGERHLVAPARRCQVPGLEPFEPFAFEGAADVRVHEIVFDGAQARCDFIVDDALFVDAFSVCIGQQPEDVPN